MYRLSKIVDYSNELPLAKSKAIILDICHLFVRRRVKTARKSIDKNFQNLMLHQDVEI